MLNTRLILRNRLRCTGSGRHGLLHLEVAIADGWAMLGSNANLMEFAMTPKTEDAILHGASWSSQATATLPAGHERCHIRVGRLPSPYEIQR